jgi:hypothetical protein
MFDEGLEEPIISKQASLNKTELPIVVPGKEE